MGGFVYLKVGLLSCDASWDMTKGKGGVGWVLYDHIGALITAGTNSIWGELDVLFVEVSAIVARL